MSLEVKNKTYNENLNWRYATKKFNPNKELSEDDLNTLLESIQLTASSYGLQPYEVIVVKNPEIREKLKAAAWNQSQITEASYLLVFASLKSVSKSYLDSYLDNIAETRNMSREDLKGMEDIKGPSNIKTYSESRLRSYDEVKGVDDIKGISELKGLSDIKSYKESKLKSYDDIKGINAIKGTENIKHYD